MDLTSLSNDELIALRRYKMNDVSRYKNYQMSKKVQL